MAQNYVLLERIELNASAASVTFSNIPQSGYTDLKVVVSARGTTSSTPDIWVRMNGLTTGYSGRFISSSGSSAGSGTRSVSAWAVGVINYSTTTSNTFNSQEIYIPNYLSSNAKSVSSESVQENNGTTAYMYMFANLQTSTAAISSLTLLLEDSTNFVAGSTFSLYGLADVNTTPAIAPKASGGNITTDGTYWIHTFNSTGTFTPALSLSCSYLVVAGGGGGGGGYYSGGGGAGGLRSTVTATGGGGSLESAINVTNQAYTITVGAGGAGGPSTIDVGANGSDSVFSTITAVGGGGGGKFGGANGVAGGSGGGGSNNGNSRGAGGAGTANQGYAGGDGSPNGGEYNSGGGGGGAGAVGQQSQQSTSNPWSGTGGAGGNGVAVAISGASVTYAGGGGGGQGNPSGTQGAGGSGGGGAGGKTGGLAATAGTTNLGAGGGGAGGYPQIGAAGGSGVVIIRYTIA